MLYKKPYEQKVCPVQYCPLNIVLGILPSWSDNCDHEILHCNPANLRGPPLLPEPEDLPTAVFDDADVYFLVPGDINLLTGGYAYDRQLLAGLNQQGLKVQHIALSATFPNPDTLAIKQATACFAAIPDQATVLVDGLAFGVLPELAELHHQRLKLVALCHHPLALETGLDEDKAAQLLIAEQRALAAASAIVVTSAATGALLRKQFQVMPDKITVAMPGTDPQAFALCQGQPPLLLTVATLTRRKAHDVLINALAAVRDLPWHARFVGGSEHDPHWAQYLQEKVTAMNLQARIAFIGAVADTGPEYRQADLFVLPSLYEGYGMAFAEALAYGLPVVAAHSGAVPDVVPRSAGILVPPGDAQALAQALRSVLSQPELRQGLQRGAQLAAASLPAWKTTAGVVTDLIRSMQ